MAECFTPDGSCLLDDNPDGNELACWSNGAGMGDDSIELTFYGPAQKFCYYASVDASHASVTRGISYDRAAGVLNCPDDGTFVFIGSEYAGCPALRDLLEPDLTTCGPGTCPRGH